MNRMSLSLPPINVPRTPPLTSSLPTLLSVKPHPPPTLLSSSYDQESDIFEDMPLSLVLPDGITHHLIVKTGETVQEIKRRLDTVHGIPYADATLYYNGKCMIDPLSLNDFPGLISKTGATLDVKISSAWGSKDTAQHSNQSLQQQQQAHPSPPSPSSQTPPPPAALAPRPEEPHPPAFQHPPSPLRLHTPPRMHTPPKLPPISIPGAIPATSPPSLFPSPSLSPPPPSLLPSLSLPPDATHTSNDQSSKMNSSPSNTSGPPGARNGFVTEVFINNTLNIHNSTNFDPSRLLTDAPESPPTPSLLIPLPNAFSDSPNMVVNRRKPEEPLKTGTTTIDVKDDEESKEIQKLEKLGTSRKRWKLCFLL